MEGVQIYRMNDGMKYNNKKQANNKVRSQNSVLKRTKVIHWQELAAEEAAPTRREHSTLKLSSIIIVISSCSSDLTGC